MIIENCVMCNSKLKEIDFLMFKELCFVQHWCVPCAKNGGFISNHLIDLLARVINKKKLES